MTTEQKNEQPFDLAAAVAAAVPSEEFVSANAEYDGDGYSNAAYYAAQVLMRCAAVDPDVFAAEAQRFREDPYCDAFEALIPRDDTRTVREIVFVGQYGLTGFQWGYAINAALTLLEQPGAPNPAILTIGGTS